MNVWVLEEKISNSFKKFHLFYSRPPSSLFNILATHPYLYTSDPLPAHILADGALMH